MDAQSLDYVMFDFCRDRSTGSSIEQAAENTLQARIEAGFSLLRLWDDIVIRCNTIHGTFEEISFYREVKSKLEEKIAEDRGKGPA